MKHTKGPWKIDFETSQDGPVISGPNDVIFAQVYSKKSDAQLIAAAPDLLEACKKAAKFLDFAMPMTPQGDLLEELLEAISKAEE